MKDFSKRQAENLLDADRRIQERRACIDRARVSLRDVFHLDMAEAKRKQLQESYNILDGLAEVLDEQQEAINKEVR